MPATSPDAQLIPLADDLIASRKFGALPLTALLVSSKVAT